MFKSFIENASFDKFLSEAKKSLGKIKHIENIHLEKNNYTPKIKEFYDENIAKIDGIIVPKMPIGVTNSYQYYPIIIEDNYPMTRDELYEKFKEQNILTRKYFYPACHDYECYKNDITVKTARLRTTDNLKKKVLCLPFYGALDKETLKRIVEVL